MQKEWCSKPKYKTSPKLPPSSLTLTVKLLEADLLKQPSFQWQKGTLVISYFSTTSETKTSTVSVFYFLMWLDTKTLRTCKQEEPGSASGQPAVSTRMPQVRKCIAKGEKVQFTVLCFINILNSHYVWLVSISRIGWNSSAGWNNAWPHEVLQGDRPHKNQISHLWDTCSRPYTLVCGLICGLRRAAAESWRNVAFKHKS